MENALKHSSSKFCLIGKINGLATESKRARKRLISSTTEKAVWRCAEQKRVVGIDIRHHLLAYAFLRGTSYSKVERTCAESNKPQAELLLRIIEAHAPSFIPFDPITQKRGGLYKVTLGDVNVWLADKAVV
jgi:stage III sporulation protein SpoIIIAA